MVKFLEFMEVYRQLCIILMISNRFKEFKKFRMKVHLLTLCGAILMVINQALVSQQEVLVTSLVKTSVKDSFKKMI